MTEYTDGLAETSPIGLNRLRDYFIGADLQSGTANSTGKGAGSPAGDCEKTGTVL